MQKVLLSVMVLFAMLVSGCASVPMGDATRDAELKIFKPKADKAGLYVFRNENFGAR